MTEPRELSYLVPVDVLAEVNTAVTVLETYGPGANDEALRQSGPGDHGGLEGREPGPGHRRRLAARQTRHRDRPWLGGGLSAGLQPRPAWPGHPTNLTDARRHTSALWRARRAIERREPLVAWAIRGVRLFGPRNAGPAGGVCSEVDGRVRPTLRPRDSPSASGPGSEHRTAQVAVPGEGIPWPPCRTPSDVEAGPDGSGQRSCWLDCRATALQVGGPVDPTRLLAFGYRVLRSGRIFLVASGRVV